MKLPRFALLVFCAAACFGQAAMSEQEEQHLRQVLSEASGSPVDLIRALELHLSKYPDSPKKGDMERAIAKAAIQAKDNKRIVQYGERALKAQPDDLTILEPVCRALVSQRDAAASKSALELSRRFEQIMRGVANEPNEGAPDRAKRKDETDRLLGLAILYQSIAVETLNDAKTAAGLARKSFDTYPSGEAAAQLGKCLTQAGSMDDAVRAYADAFSIPDPRATDADRTALRRRMGELYQRAHGDEKGLGDIILQEWDRMAALQAERRLALKQYDPNLDITNPMDFTLTGLNGDQLKLSSLAGKVILMDFWATWCGPCRAQHPLYEEIKKRFGSRPEVAFLSINADEDRSAVKPFLAEIGWSQKVYFEGGLSRNLRVSAIPTTIIFNKRGEIVTRMNGFNPERFVETITERINEALK